MYLCTLTSESCEAALFGSRRFGEDFLFHGCWVGGYNGHNAPSVLHLINVWDLTFKSFFLAFSCLFCLFFFVIGRGIMRWKKRTLC